MLRNLLAAAAGVMLAAAPAFAADAPNATLARLRSVGVAVALPAETPPGFRLARVLTPRAWAGPAFGASYVALYEGPDGQGFAVESAGADLGGGGTAWETPPSATVTPRYFAHAPAVGLYWRGPRTNVAPSWVSDWIEGPGQYYRLIGPAHVRNDHGEVWAPTRELSRAWAVKVLGSLRLAGAGVRPKTSPGAQPTPFVSDYELE